MDEKRQELESQIVTLARTTGMSIEEVWQLFKKVVEAFENIADMLRNAIRNFANKFDGIFKENCYEAFKSKPERVRYKLNFTRTKIQHQVLSRKPKVTRKIIY